MPGARGRVKDRRCLWGGRSMALHAKLSYIGKSPDGFRRVPEVQSLFICGPTIARRGTTGSFIYKLMEVSLRTLSQLFFPLFLHLPLKSLLLSLSLPIPLFLASPSILSPTWMNVYMWMTAKDRHSGSLEVWGLDDRSRWMVGEWPMTYQTKERVLGVSRLQRMCLRQKSFFFLVL